MAGFGVLTWAFAVLAPVPAPMPVDLPPAAERLLTYRPVQDALGLPKPVEADRLTPKQRVRLRQLHWQVRGFTAFDERPVRTALNLTADQRQDAAAFTKQLQTRIDRYIAVYGNDDADNLKGEVLRFHAEAVKSVDAALTPEQRARWEAMCGEPARFDTTKMWLTAVEDDGLFPPECVPG